VRDPLGRAYWAHHNSAANYAVANRHLIVHGIDEALSEVFGGEHEPHLLSQDLSPGVFRTMERFPGSLRLPHESKPQDKRSRS